MCALYLLRRSSGSRNERARDIIGCLSDLSVLMDNALDTFLLSSVGTLPQPTTNGREDAVKT